VNGHNKARALYHAVEGSITQMWTISALQMHEKGGIEPSTVVKCTEDEPEIVRQGKGWLEES